MSFIAAPHRGQAGPVPSFRSDTNFDPSTAFLYRLNARCAGWLRAVRAIQDRGQDRTDDQLRRCWCATATKALQLSIRASPMTPKQQRNARSQLENGRDLDEVIVDLDADSERSKKLRGRLLLRRFWQSAASFWHGTGSRRSWLLTGAILLTIVLNLAVSYGMNIWNRAIFDALEKQDSGTVLSN
jgi:hypothetical protein